ncbi:MAG: DUF1282 family protein [Candidatus Niameybacter stercoravium]|nr:DUF1282 family protein [Candidatus Niameybacter stercoravium]
MKQFIEDFKYLKYTIFHPFDAFYEIKWRGKGNMLLATLLLVLYSIVQVISYQYTGFIMNENPLFEMNSIAIIVIAVAPLFLFMISNWSVSTLYNGKAKIKDLYVLVAYSLFPMIIINVITILLSNIVIMEEASLVFAFGTIGTLWFLFLMFTGLSTMHEFNIEENIMTLLATAIAAVIIIFLCVLYFSLMEQVINFVTTISQEFMRRW